MLPPLSLLLLLQLSLVLPGNAAKPSTPACTTYMYDCHQLKCNKQHEFACTDRTRCIPHRWWCDNFADCPDHSDEATCGPKGSCGRPEVLPAEGRIVGGSEAVPHSWPWVVQLRVDGRLYCSGSIIAKRWIVTTAVCVRHRETSRYLFDAGRHCRDCDEKSLQRRKAARIIRHPKFNYRRRENDIALVELDKPLQFNSKVSAVCLPPATAAAGTFCVTVGWGDTRGTGDNSKLRQVTVPIVPLSVCNDAKHHDGFATAGMVCAGYEQGGKDFCYDDHGGPLMRKAGGRWFLQGFSTWPFCGRPRLPGLYTRVHHYVQWITDTIAESQRHHHGYGDFYY